MPTRGGSAPGLYVSLKPILPQNQLPVADGSLVLAPKSFLDHEGLSLRAAIPPQLLRLQGQVGSGGDIVTALHDTAINLAVLSIPAAASSQSPLCATCQAAISLLRAWGNPATLP